MRQPNQLISAVVLRLALTLFLSTPVFFMSTLSAQTGAFPNPAVRDPCPVCGMLVARYPAWIATIVYADGHASHFDGAKDMFKYLFDPQRYANNRDPEQILAIGVTEYYGLTRINAETAWYVLGSAVLGPMGHELIPLASLDDAEEFLADHNGVVIVRFGDVTPEMIDSLD